MAEKPEAQFPLLQRTGGANRRGGHSRRTFSPETHPAGGYLKSRPIRHFLRRPPHRFEPASAPVFPAPAITVQTTRSERCVAWPESLQPLLDESICREGEL